VIIVRTLSVRKCMLFNEILWKNIHFIVKINAQLV
jgi:hypothetical protein